MAFATYIVLNSQIFQASSGFPGMEQRTKLYDKMERDLDENGPKFLQHGETSQSLSLSDLFTLKDESVTPVLKVILRRNENFAISFILGSESQLACPVGCKPSCTS